MPGVLETEGVFTEVLLKIVTADALANVVALAKILPGIPVTVRGTAIKE